MCLSTRFYGTPGPAVGEFITFLRKSSHLFFNTDEIDESDSNALAAYVEYDAAGTVCK